MALQPQAVTGQGHTAHLFRYSPEYHGYGFTRTTPLCLHLEKIRLLSKANAIYYPMVQKKGLAQLGVVLAQSAPGSITSFEETEAVRTSNSSEGSVPIQADSSQQPLLSVEAAPVPQDTSSTLDSSDGFAGRTAYDSGIGDTLPAGPSSSQPEMNLPDSASISAEGSSLPQPELNLPDIANSSADNSINAASNSSQEAANTASDTLSTDQFKSAKEAYEALVSGSGNETNQDTSLSLTSESLANGISEAKAAIIDGLTKVQESYQSSVDNAVNSLKSIYDNINGSLVGFFQNVKDSDGKSVTLSVPKVEKVGDSGENYVDILLSPVQVGTPVNNALKQLVTTIEDISSRVLVGTAELLGQGYFSVKNALPEDAQLYFNGIEKKLAEISGPLQNVLQQVYAILINAERAVGIDPENPVVAIAFVAGGGLSLGLIYWQSRYGGYSGDLAPASALEILKKEGNILLIDIRSEDLRESEGILDLRGQMRLKVASIAQIKVESALQKMLKSTVDAEAAITAAAIRNLKNVQPNTKVILLDSDGSQSKIIARALKRAGIKKPFRIDGGFRAWRATGLRVKQMGPETPLTFLREETEAILEEVKPTPIVIGAAALGTLAGVYALIEWEKTLQFLGLVCIGQVLYTRINSYENADDAKNDLKVLLRPFTLVTQGIIWAAGMMEPSKLQLATTPSTSAVQDRVLQAAARHGQLPSESEQKHEVVPQAVEMVDSKPDDDSVIEEDLS
ncbi:hypothetical protein KP509_37G006300 [Ceratopteris richardii]|uniref:Rhodanese domain-containing protein n=1 Tax=Ceratopteris richardii TaxID=49495 RepID=A0A8T2Q5T1_CERRI|nr:hypothetical protein KP509_37G006300 [Ceratopteris richardii]KAH7279125.1 hypothetical protein KP509_37G006300 [Ceratopteris richardii]KAH7279126.1 hypothetical protein KP509_37G006300 [Ceratopteris richardii]KAH7279127.1 hypothetical protein KP509_37G006300 [Ceratopteris richardii]KAH7279128.1 hypothetical protein KP509_37G006300 [Ceratopteris richardii]